MNNTMNCLIVEDEPLAREILQTYVSKIPDWTVVAHCINAEEAYEALLKYHIDVIFLDIEMPIISGVDFLKSLKNPPFIVFTTAYSEYAVKGFELDIIDYLLKPITFHRFSEAIGKVNKAKRSDDLLNDKRKESNVSYFFVKNNNKLLKINFSDIVYIKAEKEYSTIHLKNDNILVSMHLKVLEDLLPKNKFTRVHRSYIVPHDHIISICGNTFYISNDVQIPIGNTYKENLLKKLNIV